VIWLILGMVGVPLWLIAIALLTIAFRNRALRHRPGNIAVRLRADPTKRWRRGHAVWVHDVLAFRGSPAAWADTLEQVSTATSRAASDQEARKLRGLDDPVIVTLSLPGGRTLEVAANGADEPDLLAPFLGTVLGPEPAG
jgi:hypothetical protein